MNDKCPTWWRRLATRWLPRREQPLRHLTFIMVTRRGCHLCDNAWQRLRAWQRREGFSLEAIDVDGDPELVAQYGTLVPVVTVNGRVRFRGCVNEVLLARLLTAERRRAEKGET